MQIPAYNFVCPKNHLPSQSAIGEPDGLPGTTWPAGCSHPGRIGPAFLRQTCTGPAHLIEGELAWINHWKEPKRLRSYREFELYWRGAVGAAAERGFQLKEFVVDETLPFDRLDKVLRSRKVRGILIPPHGGEAVTCPRVSSMGWSRYAVIRLGHSIPDFPAHTVAANHLQATVMALSEVRKRGYERVGYVCHLRSSTRTGAGFLISQSELAPEHRVPLLQLDLRQKRVSERLQRWLRKNKPDAVLTEVADLPLMLRSAGYRIPEDIGIAATSVLDGNVDAGVYQNSEEIGAVAVETLISLIHQNETGFPTARREVLVNATWQDGSTLPDRRCPSNLETTAGLSIP